MWEVGDLMHQWEELQAAADLTRPPTTDEIVTRLQNRYNPRYAVRRNRLINGDFSGKQPPPRAGTPFAPRGRADNVSANA